MQQRLASFCCCCLHLDPALLLCWPHLLDVVLVHAVAAGLGGVVSGGYTAPGGSP